MSKRRESWVEFYRSARSHPPEPTCLPEETFSVGDELDEVGTPPLPFADDVEKSIERSRSSAPPERILCKVCFRRKPRTSPAPPDDDLATCADCKETLS